MKSNIGQVIKELREKQGLTQKELASITGKSRTYISDIERNRYAPSLATLYSIAKALNVDMSHIFLLSEHGVTEQNKNIS